MKSDISYAVYAVLLFACVIGVRYVLSNVPMPQNTSMPPVVHLEAPAPLEPPMPDELYAYYKFDGNQWIGMAWEIVAATEKGDPRWTPSQTRYVRADEQPPLPEHA